MNLKDVSSIARVAAETSRALDKHGLTVFRSTKDWQSPLRSGGGPGPKNDHSDPTGTAATLAITRPDSLAAEHAALVANLKTFITAAANLRDQLHRLAPIDPTKIPRGRQNTIPACIVCAGPEPQPRRGMCEADYRAWLRADRPDLERFKRDRQRAIEAAQARIHEHEVA